jgi:hypothetical protein
MKKAKVKIKRIMSDKQIIDSVSKQYTETIKEKLKNVECPEHHERPRWKISGSGENLKFELVECCCQKLIGEVNKALKPLGIKLG